MGKHVLQTPAEYSFEKVGIKGKKFDVASLTSSTGCCIIETEQGHETTIIEHKCDFIYYIISGQGIFIIDGESESSTVGDLVVVPAGSKFTYRGNCKMLLVTSPAFYIEQEETVE